NDASIGAVEREQDETARKIPLEQAAAVAGTRFVAAAAADISAAAADAATPGPAVGDVGTVAAGAGAATEAIGPLRSSLRRFFMAASAVTAMTATAIRVTAATEIAATSNAATRTGRAIAAGSGVATAKAARLSHWERECLDAPFLFARALLFPRIQHFITKSARASRLLSIVSYGTAGWGQTASVPGRPSWRPLRAPAG
ncbi:hypothetical protein, partial [Rhodomicrobium vannielii]|uniref:hypothetical protein n=1 Tax=Rhodomicrobium vannielii TaxID=1069 RepID=UPI001AECBE4E